MNTKWVTLALIILIVVLVAYFASPDVQTTVDGFIATAIITGTAWVQSFTVTPVYQIYIGPYLHWWTLVAGGLIVGLGAFGFLRLRRWMARSAYKETPWAQGAPGYTQPVPTAQPPQPQPVQVQQPQPPPPQQKPES